MPPRRVNLQPLPGSSAQHAQQPVSSESLSESLRTGLSNIASQCSQLSNSTNKTLTEAEVNGIVDELQTLITRCGAMKKIAEQLQQTVNEEASAKLRADEAKAKAKKGKYKPVQVPKGSPVAQHVIKRIRRSKKAKREVGITPTIWKCSGADSDGVCREGARPCKASNKIRNVINHIKKVHEAPEPSRIAEFEKVAKQMYSD